jgi:hypothetical protein
MERLNYLTSQSKAEAYQRIESILEKAGSAGVHRAHFLYTLFWSQIQARVHEMNRLGWLIESVPLPKSEWQHSIRTKYILRAKPLEVASGQDWYEVLKGRPRGSEDSHVTAGPLFAEIAP